MATKEYDIVVLGGGTGGYVAAIRAAQLGKKVAIVEKDKLGGTCLHRGCIPSKSLLRSAEMFNAMKQADTYGIKAGAVEIDFGQVMKRKDGIVDQLYSGVQLLMKKNRIDVIKGEGRVIGPSIFSPRSGAVSIQNTGDKDISGEEEYVLIPRHLIIATGSRPKTLPGWNPGEAGVMTSDEALNMDRLPKSVIVIGGGVIGIEWASMLNDFGVKVTVVEAEARILPTEDEAISREMRRLLEKRGVVIMTDARVVPDSLQEQAGEQTVRVSTKDNEQQLAAERILVSVGRTPNTEGIGLENTGVEIGEYGIQVNKYMQTAEPHIYAIGDCTGGLQLAHVASHQGIIAVEHIAGLKPEPYAEDRVPRCIYSRPEIASVGLSERQAKERGIDVKTGVIPFSAIGKAWLHGDADGFVKVVSDRESDDLLGVHMIGPQVTDLISEAALARVLDATPWEVAGTIHPHPTLSEAIGEAMAAVDEKAVGI